MKKLNLTYWIITGLFGAFMFFTAVPNLLTDVESVAFINDMLGYPEYIIPFLGVAKILGVIAILVPGFPLIKEWAYAGLFFDLAGATYSVIAAAGFDPGLLMMVVIIAALFTSYYLHHRRMNLKKNAA